MLRAPSQMAGNEGRVLIHSGFERIIFYLWKCTVSSHARSVCLSEISDCSHTTIPAPNIIHSLDHDEFLPLLLGSGCLGHIRQAEPRPEGRPEIGGVQPEVAPPVELVRVDNLPVELPGHLGQQHARLPVPHVLPDAAAGARAEGPEALVHILGEGRVVVRVRGREPALRAEGVRLVPVPLAVEGGVDGGLDFVLLERVLSRLDVFFFFFGRGRGVNIKGEGSQKIRAQRTYSRRNPVPIHCRTWAEARLPKGPVGVQPQRLLDDGGHPRQMRELLVLNIIVLLELAPDLVGKLLELVRVLRKEQDGGPEQLRVRVQPADEDVVDLRQEPVRVLAGNSPAFLDERGEVVALLVIFGVLHAFAHDALVLAKEPNQAGRQHEVDEGVEERETLEDLVQRDPMDDAVEPSERVRLLLVLDVLVVVAVAQAPG